MFTSMVGVRAPLLCSPTVFSPRGKSHLPPKLLSLKPKEMYPRSLRVNCVSFESLDARRRELLGGSTPGVVILQTKTMDSVWGKETVTQISSGYLVSENGLILTCCHCVSPRNPFYVGEPMVDVSFLDKESPKVRAEVVTLVRDLDIAVLKVPSIPNSSKNHVIKLSKSPPQSGDSCFLVGHPGVEYACRSGVEYACRSGVVSSAVRYPYHFPSAVWGCLFNKIVDGFYLTELDIRSTVGFSGGPVLNLDGEALGMLVGQPSGCGVLAIPANFCRAVLSYAMKNKEKSDGVWVDASLLVTADEPGMKATEIKNRFGKRGCSIQVESVGKFVGWQERL
ncbi:hypothetical protein Vadar_015204 [Vaccinium darrowii]|uniref:Uncharacterized protein n=1 Tax=Vaccinium darrowii TaxID=229202 RepID=A0ACB7YMF4_9ERIC|nr:hypothetical protein Vadar_015204 [Vaccinium darrowii]